MHLRKTLGYVSYPILFLSLFAAQHLRAQSTNTSQTDSQQQTQPDQQQPNAAPEQQQPAASSSQTAPNEQQRIRLAREAQERVRARRRQRIQAIIQDTYSHKYEASLGYAYLRMRPGHSLQNLTETGWNVDLTDYIRPHLGITADLRGYYGNAYVGNNIYGIFKPFISNYSVMAGPQYRFVEHRSYAVSAYAFAGMARNIFAGNSQGFPGTLLGLYPDEFRFAAAAGLPVDFNVSPALAVRLTPTYYLTTFGGETQNNRGFTASVVYRFGRH